MVNEVFLIEEEKEKILSKCRNYISKVAVKHERTMRKIINKDLRPKARSLKENINHYMHRMAKNDKEITAKIAKDEASSKKSRLRNCSKIQALRDKSYTFNKYWTQKINSDNRSIRYKNYMGPLNKDKTLEKVISGSKVSFAKAIVSISNFLSPILWWGGIICSVLLAIYYFLISFAGVDAGYPILYILIALLVGGLTVRIFDTLCILDVGFSSVIMLHNTDLLF